MRDTALRQLLRQAGPWLMAAILIGAVPAIGEESLYRWLDDRGNPVYSDRPPPAGIDYEVISSRSSLKRVVPAEEGAVPPEVTPRVGNEFQPVSSRPESQSFKSSEICARARENLEMLQSYPRLQIRNDQGDMELIDEEQRIRLMEEAEAQISRHCE
tara:strand:- start:120973 stop:121443 length:471 start_codon:yes stop_codon:yes gene_type:complete